MVRARITIDDIGSYKYNKYVVKYIPYGGQTHILTILGEREFGTIKEAKDAIRRAGGANKIKKNFRNYM